MNGSSVTDVERRGVAAVTVAYRSWLRYGDRDARFRAKTIAWVLTDDYATHVWRPVQEQARPGRSTDHGGPTVGTPQQGGNPT